MNQLARDIYQEYYRILANLMNEHYQISQHQTNTPYLMTLAKEIRRVAAVCETWKSIASYNATRRTFEGG